MVKEQATVPHMNEDDKTFYMNPTALTSKIKQRCFQTKHMYIQPTCAVGHKHDLGQIE